MLLHSFTINILGFMAAIFFAAAVMHSERRLRAMAVFGGTLLSIATIREMIQVLIR